jgi:DNA-binding NtrC family response regulator
MKESILSGKTILGVDDEPDILEILEEEILEACPTCRFERATNYRQAVERMVLLTYDLVILDNIGVRGFDLLELAAARNFPAIMLTDYALRPEALKPSFETGACTYFPKERLGGIVPLLEDVLKHQHRPGWKRPFVNFRRFFKTRLRVRLAKPRRYVLERV